MGIPDLERTLIEIGVERLHQVMPGLQEKLEDSRHVQLWASPAARSQETAILLGRSLDLAGVRTFSFIYEGNSDELVQALAAHGNNGTVILTGHEPQLSEWVHYLTGEHRSFKTSGIIALHVRSLEPPAADILFDIQPDTSGEDTSSNDEPVLRLKRVLLHGWTAVKADYEDFVQEPEDPDSVHAFRVSVRKLRALWSFLKPLIETEVYNEARASLKRLMGSLAGLRELDVLLTQLQEADDTDSSVNRLLPDYIRKLRHDELTEVLERINDGTLAEDLILTEHLLYSLHIAKVTKKTDRALRSRCKRWALSAAKSLATLDYSDFEETHELRIRYKKLRYVQTALPEYAADDKGLKELEIMQDDLGLICDTYVNSAYISRVVDEDETAQLQEEAADFAQSLSKQRKNLISRLQADN